MAQTKLTAKEIDDLEGSPRGGTERAPRRSSPHRGGDVRGTQSELVGDVGLDDESADAGTATFEREKDLSIENNVRDLLPRSTGRSQRIDDGTLRDLRTVRQADREGAHQGAAVRRPLHQGRQGAVAPVAAVDRARRRGAVWLFAAAGARLPRSTGSRRSGRSSGCPGDPIELIPGVRHLPVHDEPRRRVQPRAERAVVLRGGHGDRRRADRRRRRSATRACSTGARARAGARGARSATSPTG